MVAVIPFDVPLTSSCGCFSALPITASQFYTPKFGRQSSAWSIAQKPSPHVCVCARLCRRLYFAFAFRSGSRINLAISQLFTWNRTKKQKKNGAQMEKWHEKERKKLLDEGEVKWPKSVEKKRLGEKKRKANALWFCGKCVQSRKQYVDNAR